VNGIKLFFDVEGASLRPSGPWRATSPLRGCPDALDDVIRFVGQDAVR
jgi:hypothetical protein